MATTNSAALTRLSPGVYRRAGGGLVRSRDGKIEQPANPAPSNNNTNSPAPTAPSAPTPPDITRSIEPVGKAVPFQDKAPTVPPAPSTPAAQPPTVPDFSSYQSPMTKALLDAMSQGMSTMQAYEPKNFDGSPLYQFQKDKGMRDLERLMAARGLTGSGAEVQANSDFLANLNATEAEKQRQYAEANRDRQQSATQFIANFDQAERNALRDQWNSDLDRQTNINQFEANRGDARQALAVNFLNNVLGLQSQNDIARLANAGMGSQTDLTKALINAMTQNTMAQAPRTSGGGGAAPPPPQPSNNSDLWRILMNYGNNAGSNDMFNQVLSLFK